MAADKADSVNRGPWSPWDEIDRLKARDEESRRLLEDANGWLKGIVIPDALDYDRAKGGLILLIEEIGLHLKREGTR